MTAGKPTAYGQAHRWFTSAEIDETRAKGLCFWCDEKFTFGHKCANKKLYTLVLEPADAEEEIVETVMQES